MTLDQIKSTLQNQLPFSVTWLEDPFIPACRVAAADLYLLIQTLHTHPELNFIFLTDLTGVHFPDRTGEELEVVYHLHNLKDNFRLKVKVALPETKPHIASITDIYSGANWMERETFDFFGIQFDNHPNLTRILNADDMTIHPMRKEYPMEDPTRVDKDDEMFGRG